MSEVEKNYFLLYRLSIYQETGRWQELVDFANLWKKSITDKIQMHQYLAKAHVELGNWNEAKGSYETLLLYIPENESNILGYANACEHLGQTKAEAFSHLKIKNKQSKLIPILILRSLDSQDPEFAATISAQYKSACSKVSPTFFRELRVFYKDTSKVSIIETILQKNLSSLESTSTFADSPDTPQFPTSLMYAYYMLGWHHYFKSEYESALVFSTKCEDHTPSFLDNYVLKAKILKKLYMYNQAAETLKSVYKVDQADRFMINLTSKYMMQNNDIKNADAVFKEVFLNKAEAERTIHNLQKMWY